MSAYKTLRAKSCQTIFSGLLITFNYLKCYFYSFKGGVTTEKPICTS